MPWYYNNIRVITQEYGGAKKQIIARLQPLDGGTIHQTFGWEDGIVKLSGYVVGTDDITDLLNTVETGNSHTLSGALGDYGDYYLSNISFNQIPSICQTIRPDLEEDAFVYKVDLELYEDV